MTALPAWQYRDPLEAAIRAEAESCKGCVFECPVKIAGATLGICVKGKQHGSKCREFRQTLERVKVMR